MKKILYVDDAKSMRTLVQLVLQPTYEITLAEDGAQGLQAAANQNFDVIISDINMPVMNGLELLEKLRQQEKNRLTPVLLMTTENSPELKEKSRLLKATGWILKPFDPKKLPSLIERASQ